jgi:hypothetical protein
MTGSGAAEGSHLTIGLTPVYILEDLFLHKIRSNFHIWLIFARALKQAFWKMKKIS